MRPDEWANTDVERWNQAAQLKQAYQSGVADARDEADADRELKSGS